MPKELKASYNVSFEDLDYEQWGAKCGVLVQSLEPKKDGSFELTVTGSEKGIETFSADLGYGPQYLFEQ